MQRCQNHGNFEEPREFHNCVTQPVRKVLRMNHITPITHSCVICSGKEAEGVSLYKCDSCLSSVCNLCSSYKSPIPFMGLLRRARICKRCILCYSNYNTNSQKQYKFSPAHVDYSNKCYSLFAESSCCSRVYYHQLFDSERDVLFQTVVVSCPSYEITPLWVPDCLSPACFLCNKPFSLFHRRHHCRHCGKIVCNNCSNHRYDLSEFGYSTHQRVCTMCAKVLDQRKDSKDLWSNQSFSIKCLVVSFLSPRDMYSVSAVSKKTHRQFTSVDFDKIYWKFLCLKDSLRVFSIYSLLTNHDDDDVIYSPLEDAEGFNQQQEMIGDNDRSGWCYVEGCYWRFHYLVTIVIPSSLSGSLLLIAHPILFVRVAAMKNLHSISCYNHASIEQALCKKEVMLRFIKNLRFANNDMIRNNGCSPNVLSLLLYTCGCLLNVTPTSSDISKLFRENGGIAVILSILHNDCFQFHANLQREDTLSKSLGGSSSRTIASPDLNRGSGERMSRSSGEKSLQSSPENSVTPPSYTRSLNQFDSAILNQSLSSNTNLSRSYYSQRSYQNDTNIRKIMSYLTGILMNISNLDRKCCEEIGQLKGIQLLVSFLQHSQERLNKYCLECIRACCKVDNHCKDIVGSCGGIIKIINCYVSNNSLVLMAAINTTTAILSHHASNTRLFCLANGLNGLMQVEEKWKGKCGICAAKAISNILYNSTIVFEFLQQDGLKRLNVLLRRNREDIHGILLGQLMNCAMYFSKPLLISSSLLTSVIHQVVEFTRQVENYNACYGDNAQTEVLCVGSQFSMSESCISQSIQESGKDSQEGGKSFEPTTVLSDGSTVGEEEKKYRNIMMYLGYAAGFFYYAMKNEENCQLFLDYDIDYYLHLIEPFCDKQGVSFISFHPIIFFSDFNDCRLVVQEK